MIDEKNVKRVNDLPSCTGKVNHPMHAFFLRRKRERFAISFDDLGATRGDCGRYPKQLPPSAYKKTEWWIYDFNGGTHPNALAWLTAGWRIESLSLSDEYVIFVPFDLPKTIKK